MTYSEQMPSGSLVVKSTGQKSRNIDYEVLGQRAQEQGESNRVSRPSTYLESKGFGVMLGIKSIQSATRNTIMNYKACKQ